MKKKVETPTRRSLVRQGTQDEILDVARRHIAEGGIASLSLRAIAREMKLTAPALYRYFPSRDALLITLAATAYRSFADTLQAARDAAPADDRAERFFAIGMAYRKWALTHPQDYVLIFATRDPLIEESVDEVEVEGQRALGVLIGALNDLWEAGEINPAATYTKPSNVLQAQLNKMKKEYAIPVKTPVIHLALVVWSRVHGLVSLELVGTLPGFLGDAEEFYRAELAELGNQLGIKKKSR